jgi:hypothetical protein
MKDVCFMHIQGGKLYGTSITSQVLWDVLMFPKGLNPSKVRRSLTFLLSDEISNVNYQMTSMPHRLLDASICRPSCGHLHATSYRVWYVAT